MSKKQSSIKEQLLSAQIEVIRASEKEEYAARTYDGSDESITNFQAAENALNDALAKRAAALDRSCRSDA